MRIAGWSLLAANIALIGACQVSGVAADDPQQPANQQPPAARRATEGAGRSISGVAQAETVDQAAPAGTAAPFQSRHRARGMASRSARHEQLRARRLARIEQMRQSAVEGGDTQNAERAQYLEGMVNELHDRGLFSFSIKLVNAIQEGQLQAADPQSGGSAGAIEIPDADLGSSAPLPGAEQGETAPPPGVTEDAPPVND